MNINEEKIGSVLIVSLIGRLDIMTSETLQAKINELIDVRNERQLLFDCSELSFISSAGLRLFMICLKKLVPVGGRLAFCSFNQNNRKIFDITGYDKMFSIFDDRFEALSNFEKS